MSYTNVIFFSIFSFFSFFSLANEKFKFDLVLLTTLQGQLINLGDKQVCMTIAGEQKNNSLEFDLILNKDGSHHGQRLVPWGFALNDSGAEGTILFNVEKQANGLVSLNVTIKKNEIVLSENNFIIDFELNLNSEKIHILNYISPEPCRGSIIINIFPKNL